jgi:hypothetical protein
MFFLPSTDGAAETLTPTGRPNTEHQTVLACPSAGAGASVHDAHVTFEGATQLAPNLNLVLLSPPQGPGEPCTLDFGILLRASRGGTYETARGAARRRKTTISPPA